MLASHHTMTEVARALRPPPPRATESRRASRVRVRTPVMILVRDGAGVGAVHVQVRDLSPGGMGLFRARPMGLDEPFVAELPRDADRAAVHMLCSVVYYEPIAEGLFSIGARFIRVLTPPEVRAARATLNAAALGMNDPFGEEYPTRAA